jgi:hypothetical protein
MVPRQRTWRGAYANAPYLVVSGCGEGILVSRIVADMDRRVTREYL